MNWGKGILITIIVFLAGTAIMIIIAVNSKYDLVANNYYEKGIKYQDKIDKINRTNALPEKTGIEFLGNAVSVSMPRMFASDKIKGELVFYRPSDAGKDFKIPLQLDSENKMVINTGMLEKGFWKVQLEWNIETTQYYNESFFTIN
jgi:nitrogen fixation protein FixH